MPERERFTFAQFTDVHLSDMPPFHLRHWNVKRILGFLNWHRGRKSVHRAEVVARLLTDLKNAVPKSDHIVVTGDLVNIGLPDEYTAARAWLHEVGDPSDVTVIPGNHDIYVAMKHGEGVAKWQAFMAHHPVLDATKTRQDEMVFPFVRRFGPVAFVGCNSAVPTRPFVAAGKMGETQLLALRQTLEALRAEKLVRVVLIHHPPVPGLASPRRALKDAAELQQVLQTAGAELVLYGHNHRSRLTEISGSACDAELAPQIPIIGLGSSSAARSHHGEDLARYNLFQVTREPNHVSIEMFGRGMTSVGGPIVEIEHRTFRLPL